MQFTWLLAVIFALVAVVAGQCPASFTQSGSKCVSERPIHGTCPTHSEYDVNINKCVYGK